MRGLMSNKFSRTFTATAITAIALASMLMLVPTNVYAPKTTTSGVHFQGPEPKLTCSGDTCSSTAFTLAGLGSGSGTAELQITGTFAVTCENPGGNEDVPGQRTTATGTSGQQGFTTQNGKANIGALSATLDPSTVDTSNSCPNGKWTAHVGEGTATTATLIVQFEGTTILSQSFPPA
jgi:hypothetical protein